MSPMGYHSIWAILLHSFPSFLLDRLYISQQIFRERNDRSPYKALKEGFLFPILSTIFSTLPTISVLCISDCNVIVKIIYRRLYTNH